MRAMAFRRTSSLTGIDSQPDSWSWPMVAGRDMRPRLLALPWRSDRVGGDGPAVADLVGPCGAVPPPVFVTPGRIRMPGSGAGGGGRAAAVGLGILQGLGYLVEQALDDSLVAAPVGDRDGHLRARVDGNLHRAGWI